MIRPYPNSPFVPNESLRHVLRAARTREMLWIISPTRAWWRQVVEMIEGAFGR